MNEQTPETVATQGLVHTVGFEKMRAFGQFPYAAECSCGWALAYSRSRVESRADAERHLESRELRGEAVDYDF